MEMSALLALELEYEVIMFRATVRDRSHRKGAAAASPLSERGRQLLGRNAQGPVAAACGFPSLLAGTDRQLKH